MRGVNDPETTDAAPPPALFTARSLTLYVVKFVRPGIVTGEVVPATASAQVLPSSIEN